MIKKKTNEYVDIFISGPKFHVGRWNNWRNYWLTNFHVILMFSLKHKYEVQRISTNIILSEMKVDCEQYIYIYIYIYSCLWCWDFVFDSMSNDNLYKCWCQKNEICPNGFRIVARGSADTKAHLCVYLKNVQKKINDLCHKWKKCKVRQTVRVSRTRAWEQSETISELR